jgi:predicted DNA-binding protein
VEASSVRVNLSVPVELDTVLTQLSAITGRAKASYATEALTWYLPRLQGLLAELQTSGEVGKSQIQAEAAMQPARTRGEPALVVVPLARQQKRPEGVTRTQWKKLKREGKA